MSNHTTDQTIHGDPRLASATAGGRRVVASYPSYEAAERAVDALAEIGSKKAVPTLMELLASENTRSLPTIARALGNG